MNNESAVDDLGLPLEDSEDDDFDPAVSDSSEDQKGKLHSEESDFTSDSDDFCAEIAKSFHQGETSVSPLPKVNRAFTEMELDQDGVLPVSSRRQVERLDYKKLYDVCYLFPFTNNQYMHGVFHLSYLCIFQLFLL
jgi:hypothetical protein